MKEFFAITSTFFLAWVLTLIPLPFGWQWIRPEWITLVLIYWVFMHPQTVGVLTAFTVGLLVDILSGALLGQHALSFVAIAYFARVLRERHRLLPFWQQALAILLLIGFGNLILLFVQWALGRPP